VPAGYSLRALGAEEAPLLAGLYREVFASYPFPVHDSAYIRETMDADVAYFGAFRDGRLVAASSAEMDPATSSAEMTDFATLPGETGKGLAGALLAAMEQDMPRQGISTLYTIARAFSHGMNITFARAGYEYGGTLVNNTDIFGRIESMNLWHKKAKAL
jgi:putative beta-lysine N-acetyltransferase